MTVERNKSRLQFKGDGSKTLFPVDFRIFKDSEVVVQLDDGPELTLNSDFQILNIDIENESFDLDFSVSSAPAAGVTITVFRRLDRTQPGDYIEGDDFPAETHERILDRQTMLIQEIDDAVKRSLRFPETDEISLSPVLPPADERAGQLLGFGANGETIATQPSAALASAFMQTVLDDPDAETARETLGAASQADLDTAKTDIVALEGRVTTNEAAVAAAPSVVGTIAALKALTVANLADGDVVWVLGYYSALGDRGGGLFRWNASSTTADDGGAVIEADDAPATGRWIRQVNQPYYVFEWFGAKVDDDSFDNAPILNNVCTAMKRDGLRLLYLGQASDYYFNTRPNAFDFGIRIIGQQPRAFLVRNYTESNTYTAADPTTLGDAAFMRWNGGAYAELGNDTAHPKGGGLENVGLMAPNGTSGGVAIGMYGIDDNNRAAFLDLKNVTVTGEGTGEWDLGWVVDGGNLTTAGTPGIRNVSFEGVYIWRCRTEHARFRNAVHLSGHLLSINDGGLGVTPNIRINGTGTANGDSESVHITGLDCYGDVNLTNCTNVHISGRCNDFSSTVSATKVTFIGSIEGTINNGSVEIAFYLPDGPFVPS